MRPLFPNPANSSQVVQVILDVCHMVLRNTQAEGGLQLAPKKCRYLVELNKLQVTEGLGLGNKLKLANIRWERQKIKVKLATKVFGNSGLPENH